MLLVGLLVISGAAFWLTIRRPLSRMLELHEELLAIRSDIPTPAGNTWYHDDQFAQDLSGPDSTVKRKCSPCNDLVEY
jgi:hypothetical protein